MNRSVGPSPRAKRLDQALTGTCRTAVPAWTKDGRAHAAPADLSLPDLSHGPATTRPRSPAWLRVPALQRGVGATTIRLGWSSPFGLSLRAVSGADGCSLRDHGTGPHELFSDAG